MLNSYTLALIEGVQYLPMSLLQVSCLLIGPRFLRVPKVTEGHLGRFLLEFPPRYGCLFFDSIPKDRKKLHNLVLDLKVLFSGWDAAGCRGYSEGKTIAKWNCFVFRPLHHRTTLCFFYDILIYRLSLYFYMLIPLYSTNVLLLCSDALMLLYDQTIIPL